MSRKSSSRPSSGRRASSVDSKKEDLIYECKAAYVTLFEDTEEKIMSRTKLQMLLQQTGRNPSKRILDKHWKEDTTSLTFDDFCHICEKIPATSEDDLMKAFKKIDINGDGFITHKELLKVLTTKGEKMTEAEVKAMIDEVDENKDGKLDYKEFSNMVLSTTEECKKVAKQKLEKKQKAPKKSSRPSLGKDTEKESAPAEENQGNKGKGSQASLRSQKDDDNSDKEDSKKMGSQISVKSLAQSENQDSKKMGSQASFKSVREDKKSDKEDSKKMGSQISVKSIAQNEKEDSKKMGSQASLKSIREDKKNKETELVSRSGSQTSLRSMKKDEEQSNQEIAEHSRLSIGENGYSEDSDNCDIVLPGKQSKKVIPPKPKPRKLSLDLVKVESESQADHPKPSPRTKKLEEKTMPPVANLKTRLQEPKRINDWTKLKSKGCFFLEDDGSIISHQYTLNLPSETSVWFTIEPIALHPEEENKAPPVDTALFILRDKPDSSGHRLVTFTEQRDVRGKYCVRCDLKKGKYSLLPFTTGCRLRKRKSQPKVETKLIKKDRDDNYVLTKAFRDVLSDIFEVADLDGNGLLSRNEFNIYNLRTSGEEVADEEWEVVEENVEIKKGELTRKGFLDLNQMEAEDNEGDTEDLWVTLQSMGYNKELIQDEACPFSMEVYTEDCPEAELKVIDIKSGGAALDAAVCQSVVNKGEANKIKSTRDVLVHSYTSNHRVSMVVENKTSSKSLVRLDCSKSTNSNTNKHSLECDVDIPVGELVLGHHILPIDEKKEWFFHCAESILK